MVKLEILACGSRAKLSRVCLIVLYGYMLRIEDDASSVNSLTPGGRQFSFRVSFHTLLLRLRVFEISIWSFGQSAYFHLKGIQRHAKGRLAEAEGLLKTLDVVDVRPEVALGG